MQTPLPSEKKKKKYAKLMVDAHVKRIKSCLLHIFTRRGEKHLDKDPWKGKFALTVKRAASPSALFVNALIVLLGLKIQLAIT